MPGSRGSLEPDDDSDVRRVQAGWSVRALLLQLLLAPCKRAAGNFVAAPFCHLPSLLLLRPLLLRTCCVQTSMVQFGIQFPWHACAAGAPGHAGAASAAAGGAALCGTHDPQVEVGCRRPDIMPCRAMIVTILHV